MFNHDIDKSIGKGRKSKKQKLGYYVILTDTDETEKNYITGFIASLPVEYRNHIKPPEKKIETSELVNEAVKQLSSSAQYSDAWVIFDKDRFSGFDDLINQANRQGIHAAWSNPCFEVWLSGYYSSKIKSTDDSVRCCSEFSKQFKRINNQEYDKADEKIYEKLIKKGNEKRAINLARARYSNCKNDDIGNFSDMTFCTTMYLLIDEIRKAVEGT